MVFWGLILSYMTILIIPIILTSTLTYGKYNAELEKRIGYSIENMLLQMQDIIDGQMNELNNLPIKMQKTQRLFAVLAARDVSRFTAYDLHEGVNELYNFRALNNYIDNIILYKPRNDMIVTTSSVTDIPTFFNKMNTYIGMSEEDFRKKIQSVEDVAVWTAQGVLEGGMRYATDKITYIRGMSLENNPSMDTKLIVTIDDSTLKNLFTKALGNYEGYIGILDQSGNVISYVEKGDAPVNKELLNSVLHKDKGLFTAMVDSRKVLVASSGSNRMPWKYVSVIPAEQVFFEVNRIRNLTFYVLTGVFLVCMLLVFYFAKRNYTPVKNLIEMLAPDRGPAAKSKYCNEWEIIKNEIYTAVSRQKSLEGYINQQLPVLKSNFIRLLLKGEIPDTETACRKLKPVGLRINNGPFAVMHFSIDGYLYTENEKRGLNEEDIILFTFSVCNVVEELCQPVGVCHTVETNDAEVAALLCFKSQEVQENGAAMKEIAQKAIDFFEQHFHITLTVGLGGIYENLSDIKYSFKEAKTALEYKIIKGSQTVIDFADIKVVPGFINYYTVDDEKNISDCLKHGNIEGVENILNGIMQNLHENLPSLETARCVYFEILNTALRMFDIIGMDHDGALSVSNHFSVLLSCKTMDELYHETLTFYRRICIYINDRKESKNFRLAKRIQEYINMHYCDKNLSLVMIAEVFDVSAGYLSRFYKDQFGYNISEYIQNKRVEASKKLLTNSKMSIGDIAEELGFGTINSYIKAFKKYEVITPGEFRTRMLL